MKIYIDSQFNFVEVFNPENGFYIRSDILTPEGMKAIENPGDNFHTFLGLLVKHSTGKEPFMRSMPSLIDIGIMKTCTCSSFCNVDCYQNASASKGEDMSVENYLKIMKQSKGFVQQVALGGKGNPDDHPHFEEILSITRDFDIVPNFTTSGILMSKSKAEICKEYCGAVAVSEHSSPYTVNAVNLLVKEGVKTNIHYVLGKSSIDRAIEILNSREYYKGINAIIFLLYKPVGLGQNDNVLNINDKKIKDFFSLIDKNEQPFKIGFDSCSCSGILNLTSKINLNSIDFCEGARFSCYIDADMNIMPCSFLNQDSSYYTNLNEHTIAESWNSSIFKSFRTKLKNTCSSCPLHEKCGGGCPYLPQIALCNRQERDVG